MIWLATRKTSYPTPWSIDDEGDVRDADGNMVTAWNCSIPHEDLVSLINASVDTLKALETMTKVANQAIDLTGMRRYVVTEEPNFIRARKVQLEPTSRVPELAAYLRQKEER